MNSNFITRSLAITLVGSINYFLVSSALAQQMGCSNYWINPNTGETECFSTFSQPKKPTTRQNASESSEPQISRSSKVKVSDVLGLKIEQAKQILEEQGFKVKVIEKVEEEIPAGQIIKQQPSSGTTLVRGKTVKLTIAEEPVYKLLGTVSLLDTDSIDRGGRSCKGTGGYSDVAGGMNVRIKDGKGTVIASGRTDAGLFNGSSCLFPFRITGIPKASYYTVEVGYNRGRFDYSFEEIVRSRWKVTYFLGEKPRINLY